MGQSNLRTSFIALVYITEILVASLTQDTRGQLNQRKPQTLLKLLQLTGSLTDHKGSCSDMIPKHCTITSKLIYKMIYEFILKLSMSQITMLQYLKPQGTLYSSERVLIFV